MLVIEKPDRELMFLLQMKHRLMVEVNIPGGRWSGQRKSTMAMLNQKYGTKFRRKDAALEFASILLWYRTVR